MPPSSRRSVPVTTAAPELVPPPMPVEVEVEEEAPVGEVPEVEVEMAEVEVGEGKVEEVGVEEGEEVVAVSVRVSSMAGVSTGCGLTSIKIRCPDAAKVCTARWNCTGSRRERYQYAPSITAPSMYCPSEPDITAIVPGCALMPASESSTWLRTATMRGECEA